MEWIVTSVTMFRLQSRMNLQRLMQYRTDFAVGILITFGFSLLGPLFQYLVYTRSSGYPGWSWDQILVLQAVLLLVGGLRDMLFGDVYKRIEHLTASGELDQVLLKPYPVLMTILTGSFSPFPVVTVVTGAGAVVWASWHSATPPGLSSLLLFLVFIVASLALFLAESVLFCTLTVRWTYPRRLRETLEKIVRFGDSPMEIYPLAIRAIFVTALPLSVATYWPAQALLGRLTTLAWTALVGAFALLGGLLWLWSRQMKRYTSAGG